MEIEKIDNYIFDERFYCKYQPDGTRIYHPSVTYILGSAYPSGYGLDHWRGDVGNKRADEIIEEAGQDGTFVHESIEVILKGGKIEREAIEAKFASKRALKIMRCLQAFLDWNAEYKPKIGLTEHTVWNDEHGFAGTLDLVCEIEGETYVVDFKTSKSIHQQHKAQICAYGLAVKCDKVALLHLGNTTKKRYSWLVLKPEDREKYTNHFIQANQLFRTLNPDAHPSEESYPDIFTL